MALLVFVKAINWSGALYPDMFAENNRITSSVKVANGSNQPADLILRSCPDFSFDKTTLCAMSAPSTVSEFMVFSFRIPLNDFHKRFTLLVAMFAHQFVVGLPVLFYNLNRQPSGLFHSAKRIYKRRCFNRHLSSF
jgi:hypothetical protein